MVRKKLAVIVAALGAFQADVVSALGMGDVSLNSALNQPLNAEIRLLNTKDLDSSQVHISLAKSTDFERTGVEREFFLTNIDFTVELDGFGNGIVKLTTNEPVIEPYLNFLIETRWPTGRLLREYTVLLDLPVFSETSGQSVEQATSQIRSSTTQISRPQTVQQLPEPVNTSASVAAIRSARQAAERSNLASGESYRVQNDDTLWEIAAKSRSRTDQSIQQTMVSIQRINPRAFIKGNINRLKSGSVLRLPTESEIDDVSGRNAVKEVANQNKAWRTGEELTADTDSQLDATDREVEDATQYQEKARLSIATAGTSDQEDSVDGEGGEGVGSEALQNELHITEESLSKVELENTELQSRLDGMEEKISTLQRLLELKDDQLAAMQSGQESDAATVETEITQEQATDVETKKPVIATTPKAKKAPEPGLLDQLLENPLYGGGAGLLILAIAAVVLMRRRKNSAEDVLVEVAESEDFEEDDSLSGLSLDDVDEDVDETPVEEAESGGDSVDETDKLVAELEESIAAEQSAEEEQQPESTTTLQSETGDVIAEADIYIAYGRFQQAVELLSTAIAQEPGRSDLQVKLLQVFLESRDKQAFQKQYLSLYALGEEQPIVEIKEMLSAVEGVSDWLDELPGDFVEDTESNTISEEFDQIEDDNLVLDDELDIDLDIDLDLDDEFSSDTILDTDDQGADDRELDLQLDTVEDDSSDNKLADLDFAENLKEDSSDFGELALDDLDELALDDIDNLEELDDSDSEMSFDLEESDSSTSLELDDLSLESLEDAESADTLEFDMGDLESLEESGLDDLDLGSLDSEDDTNISSIESDDSLALEDLDLDSLDTEGASELDDLDMSSFETDIDVSNDIDSGAASINVTEDLKDLKLDLDSERDSSDPGPSEEGFDLDLESDDLDLDLEDLADTDMEELSAEFDDINEEVSLDESGELPDTEELLEEASDSDLDAGDLGDASDDIESSESEQLGLDDTDSDIEEEDDDFDFLSDTDEVATKLDLARAYIDMGDTEGAKDILDEVIQEGNNEQKQEAESLLERVD